MYRAFVIIVNLIAAITAGSIFQPEVSFNIEAPAEVVAGTEFEVRVNIKKSELEGFSRLQQDLPAGLIASSYLSSDGDFTFEEKRVRMIWLRLPRQNEFTVVYKVKVDERLKGTFDIQGKFSFVDNNERKSISTGSSPITILPSPNIDPALVVDIKDFEQKVIPYIAPAANEVQIACIRQVPAPSPAGDGYIVNILVNKESKQKFAKIEEIIPTGYEAVNIDPKEAIFTFKNGTAKFLWMNLPSQPFFTVAYKLIPKDKNSGEPRLKGKFSYLEEEKTISIEIKQTDRDLATLTSTDINQLISDLNSPQITESKKPPAKEEVKLETKVKEELKEEKTIRAFTIEKPGNNKKKSRDRVKARELKNNTPFILEPETGVYFRVQIAAGHKPVEIERYFKKFKLDKEVRKEYHDGWHKYSIGSFQVYKDARDYRVHLWNTTLIADAFVSAYNSGNRITVQEALMIDNQQWYK
jgi:hypothetical protein